jgi:hypothetical protein
LFTVHVSDPGFIRIRAEGVLTPASYDSLERAFAEELSRRGAPVALLLDLTSFRGWSVQGFLRDLRFDLRYRRSFSRIAVIGHRRWHKWSTYAAMPIFTANMRFYWPQQQELAIAWLRGSDASWRAGATSSRRHRL